MNWHKDRFIESELKQRVVCASCSKSMWLPASKADKYKACSKTCSDSLRQAIKSTRTRMCCTCGAEFVPRTSQIASGRGKFCSQKCNTSAHNAVNSPESKTRAVEARRTGIKNGSITFNYGAAHHSWKGGKDGWRDRFMSTGIISQRVKAYRQKNPHKVREWTDTRLGRKLGRLPRGTVKLLGHKQRWLCVSCSSNIKHAFHVDHIMPLALGGKHEPSNLQLLCPSCNVRKSAKHPVDFMREKGFLL